MNGRWQRTAGQAEADFRRHAALARDYRRQQILMREAARDWWRDSDARDWYVDQAGVFGRWCLEEIAVAKKLRRSP